MNPRTRIRAVAAVAAALAAATAFPALAAGSAQPSAAGTPQLAAAIPSWARGARPAAAEPASARVDIAVAMRTRNAAQLAAFDQAVSDPTSPSYRQFLTPAQYAARYAPTVAQAAAVTHWLTQRGLTVDNVSPHRTLIAAHGTASTVEQAFGVHFARYRVRGELLRAPTNEPTIPTALRTNVAAISGLAQTEMRPAASPAPAFFNARPCAKYYGQKTAKNQPKFAGTHRKWVVCGYTPSQIRSAYGIDKTHLTGKGVTVGIVDTYASPTIEKDVNTYSSRHGLPTLKKGQLLQHTYGAVSNPPEVNPGGLGVVDPQGWAGEETLDVEAVHAVAPKARIDYYAATSNFGPGLYVALNNAVESGRDQVISNSYGSADDSPDPSDKTTFDQTTAQAQATGVTIDFSSGDSGDETDKSADGFRSADYPATSPGVVAVGGTTLVINRKGHRVEETYWGTRKTPKSGNHWDFSKTVFNGGGGGGVSTTYAEPSWQRGVVPNSYATYGGVPAGRVEPDVSMDADPTTGFLMGQTQTPKKGKAAYSEYRIGGTSLSCPLFSGILALAVQRHHGKGLGLITPTLYRHSRSDKASDRLWNDPVAVKKHRHGLSTFADVRPDYTDTTDRSSSVTYSLRSLGNLATLHARDGYDDSTGLGTPKAVKLVKLLG